MARRGKVQSAQRSQKRSRQVRTQTVGTHVSRGGKRVECDFTYAEGIARRANFRRIGIIVAIAVIVLALAGGAAILAFRGVVSSEIALNDSDAQKQLVVPKTGQTQYVLVTADIGSVAQSLSHEGPDILLLLRVDFKNQKLTVINVPWNLQITTDNKSESIASLARKGDAALIDALSTFTRQDIHHFVKLSSDNLSKMIDALGGVDIYVDQVIDDPEAGSIYINQGQQTLDGAQSVVYLRATNIRMGTTDRMTHQLKFAALMFEKIFSKEGNFHTRLESLAQFFETDMSLTDIESVNSWLAGVSANDIQCVTVPGYTTEITNVSGESGGRYIGTSSSMVQMLDDIENGREVETAGTEDVGTVNPDSFSVEVQNGTSIDGAAGVTSEILEDAGFNISHVGNAEQPVYQETLVIYHEGDDGPKRAKTVIDALGLGRAIAAGAYYNFNTDVLVIVGTDFKPTS